MTRVAISVTTTEGLDPAMDPRFGRAGGFILMQDGQIILRQANPHKDAGHGAGPAAAGWLREIGADEVISGEFGPKALTALLALGITPWVAPPDIAASEAYRLFVEGNLTRKESQEA